MDTVYTSIARNITAKHDNCVDFCQVQTAKQDLGKCADPTELTASFCML